jgi:hypothetical protein
MRKLVRQVGLEGSASSSLQTVVMVEPATFGGGGNLPRNRRLSAWKSRPVGVLERVAAIRRDGLSAYQANRVRSGRERP